MAESGQLAPELSKNLGISKSIIYRWQYKSNPVAKEVGKVNSLSALQVENKELKARLKQIGLAYDFWTQCSRAWQVQKSLSHYQSDDLRVI